MHRCPRKRKDAIKGLLLFFLMFSLSLATPQIALALNESEPNNTFANADVVILDGVEFGGQLSSTSDIDIYRFNVTTPGLITFTAKPENTISDGGSIFISIKNAGSAVLAGRPMSSDSSGITLKVNASSTGYYYVVVEKNGSATITQKNYLMVGKISTDMLEIDHWEKELNGSYPIASDFALDEVEFGGQLSSTSDIDIYRFNVTTIGLITFTAKPESTTSDGGSIFISIKNAGSTVLAGRPMSSDSSGITLKANASSTGYYYVVVEKNGSSAITQKNYLITGMISTDSFETDHWEKEPNGPNAIANDIALDGVEFGGQLSSTSDIDIYRFRVTTPGLITFTARPENTTSDGGTVYISIKDAEATLLTSREMSSDSPGITLEANVRSTAYYYIVVEKNGASALTYKNYLICPIPSVVTITATAPIASEDGSTLGQFTFSRSEPTTYDLNVKFTVSGSATADVDYASLGSSVTIPAGSSSVNLIVEPKEDNITEGNETVIVTLLANAAYILGSHNIADVIITEDTVPVSVQFSSAVSKGNESLDSAIFNVTLSAESGQTVTVNYATANGTATAGSDYTATSGTLTFDPGITSQTISIPIINDTVIESDETFTVILSSPVNATLGTSTTHTYTIMNDDNNGVISFSAATYVVSEAGKSVTITAIRTGVSTGAVGVSYATSNDTATAGKDYTSKSGTLFWADGDTANKSFMVNITGDSMKEDNETFNVTIFNPTGGAVVGTLNSAVVTITDDDKLPSVQFSVVSSTASETSISAVMIVTLSAKSGQTVTVDYATTDGTATAGSDYTATSGTLMFNPGETSKTIIVPIINDTNYEANETFTVKLSSPVNATLGTRTTHIRTITNDDAKPKVQFQSASSSGSEAATPAAVVVTLTGASYQTITVKYATANGTATGGSDYTATSGILTFNPGVTTQTINVPIINDTAVESNETFTIKLTSPTNATLGTLTTHTRTILDDDAAGAASLSDAGKSISYTDNGDGTITDNNTDLMWQKCTSGQDHEMGCSGSALSFNWYQASEDVCATLALGGYTDWRLPSKEELATIVESSIPFPGPAINMSAFPNTQPDVYWSSATESAYPNLVWVVNFSDGYIYEADRNESSYVRCVRGGR